MSTTSASERPHDLGERCTSAPVQHHTSSTKAHSSSTHSMGTRSRHGLEHAHVDDKLHKHTVQTVRARRRAQRGHTERRPEVRAQRGYTRGAQGTHARIWCMFAMSCPRVCTLGAAAMPPPTGAARRRAGKRTHQFDFHGECVESYDAGASSSHPWRSFDAQSSSHVAGVFLVCPILLCHAKILSFDSFWTNWFRVYHLGAKSIVYRYR